MNSVIYLFFLATPAPLDTFYFFLLILFSLTLATEEETFSRVVLFFFFSLVPPSRRMKVCGLFFYTAADAVTPAAEKVGRHKYLHWWVYTRRCMAFFTVRFGGARRGGDLVVCLSVCLSVCSRSTLDLRRQHRPGLRSPPAPSPLLGGSPLRQKFLVTARR